MYNIKEEVFTAYTGKEIPFSYREDTNDYNTILSIVRDDEYRTKQMTYRKENVFVDIGAHLGGWSALMENLVEDARIISVEPLPENAELIRKNTHGELLQYAASNRSRIKTKIFYADDSFSGLHHKFIGNAMGFVGKDFVTVETISLNDVLKDYDSCRVMKVDAEGAEYTIFPFVSKATWGKIDYIIGEYHNPLLDPAKTRGKLFSYTRGLFEDISTDKEDRLGQFWFKRKGVI